MNAINIPSEYINPNSETLLMDLESLKFSYRHNSPNIISEFNCYVTDASFFLALLTNKAFNTIPLRQDVNSWGKLEIAGITFFL